MSGTLANIEACMPALRRYAFFLLRGQQDADDLVHDTLVRALDKLHTQRFGTDIRPWLFSILHNLFISHRRKEKLRPQAGYPDEIAAELAVEGGQEDSLRWRDLIRALNLLPVEQRSILLLVAVENLSYAEVASILAIPIGTVMSRLARGRERLRELTFGDAANPSLRRVK